MIRRLEEGKEGKEVERVRFIGRSTARPFKRKERKEGKDLFHVSRFTLHVSHPNT
ncbi:hypothetical protein HYR99_32700 [Candidatus Poribacteria bacterium]|nr:hypothetical protein [Candidatus Poribacteria bacterium]